MDKVIVNATSNITEEKLYTEKVIKDLQAENERLKAYLKDALLKRMTRFEEVYIKKINKYKQALQEIRDMATLFHSVNENKGLDRFKNNILDKINSVIGAE